MATCNLVTADDMTAKDLSTTRVVETEVESPSQSARDDEDLKAAGKKPVLKRPFGFFTMLGYVCTTMITWEGQLILLSISLMNGGLAGTVYGYLYVWLGVTCSVMTMAELASMTPTAAGQYHWVAILAPDRYKIFLSYVVGWLTTVGWQANLASGCFLAAQQLAGLGVIGNENYTPEPFHYLLLFWALLFFSVAFNAAGNWLLSRLEACTLIIHITGFVAFLIVLSYCSDHTSATNVFTSFANGGNFPTTGLSFMVGSLGPAYAFLGVDAPVHLSEEISNPLRNVPRTIIFGSLLNGVMGFAVLLAAMFTITDLGQVLGSASGFPYIAIFQNVANSTSGTLAMSSVIMIMAIFAVICFVASASRTMWAFARDNGLPGSSWLKRVEPRTTLPINAIAVSCLISMVLSFIILGSSVAMNDVVSLCINALYASYLAGNGLLLYRRLRGHVHPYEAGSGGGGGGDGGDTTLFLRNTLGADRLTWGPWRIPEPLGSVVNAVGVAYMALMYFFSFWPIYMDPTPPQMNWSSLMTGVIVIVSAAYYFLRARRTFTGPVLEVAVGGR